MIVNGKRGYWTKGVMQQWTGQEGVYFPQDPSSFRPPYAEWSGNPIYRIDGTSGSYRPGHGYENCEFFMGPMGEVSEGQLLHVLCTTHGKGKEHQPHFVAAKDALSWIYVDTLALDALEPTPVYEGGMPGDGAKVTHFIARAHDSDGRLVVALYKLDWVPSGLNEALAVV